MGDEKDVLAYFIHYNENASIQGYKEQALSVFRLGYNCICCFQKRKKNIMSNQTEEKYHSWNNRLRRLESRQ